ncbi:DUF6438 domain-containing protein [Sphingobium sp.]|uniref:DUF6438 domain-containing protein n=1 Tax=Sphingobium sp. TaxID=1912891 RepID=UPI003B3B8040
MQRTIPAAAMAIIAALSACTYGDRPTTAGAGSGAGSTGGETISVAVGPCFGFCPVYQVSIAPSGSVSYTGERHTQMLGEQHREAGSPTYGKVAAALAPYRPADGTTQRVDCDAAITDTSLYTITWRKADGTQAIATHQSRCSGGPGKALDGVLQGLPEQLGIAQWAKQVTRPGASRG